MNFRTKILKWVDDFFGDDLSGLRFVFAVFIGFALFLVFLFSGDERTLGNWSYVGASFGIISALFTGLAFAGLIVTIVQQKRQLGMQSDELKLQRKELKATRKVLKKQNKEFRLQSATMKRQQFESSLFQLLDFYKTKKEQYEYIDVVSRQENKPTYRGIEAINKLYGKLHRHLNNNSHDGIAYAKKYINKDYCGLFLSEVQNRSPEFLQIILLLISIIQYIDNNFPEEEVYYSALNSLLLNKEILILFYLAVTNSLNDDAILSLYRSKLLLRINNEIIIKDFRDKYIELLDKTDNFTNFKIFSNLNKSSEPLWASRFPVF